ncbi:MULTISPECIES: hypothetical protein [Jannaschia]|nr:MULTISPECIES: hypothetical protein [unclassified Jannaschia]
MLRKLFQIDPQTDDGLLYDVLGGVWLVTLMLSLLHLPNLVA